MTKRCKDQKCHEEVIAELHDLLKGDPEPDPKQYKELKDRIKSWYEFLDITIQIPMNEKKPWTTHELGFMTERMPLKKESGYDQTGDYAIHIRAEDIDCIGGLLAERKSLEDMNGTVGQDDNFRRFHRELGRFRKDDRFDQMIIFVEGSYTKFLNYGAPEIAFRKKAERAVEDDRMYTPLTKNERSITRHRMMKAKLASLQTKGVGIHWGDNRKEAVDYYGNCVRHWILNHYDTILKLE